MPNELLLVEPSVYAEPSCRPVTSRASHSEVEPNTLNVSAYCRMPACPLCAAFRTKAW